MTLEERIAEAIDRALFDPQRIRKPTYAAAARAVVAVLPTADVSDEAIKNAVYFGGDKISQVRALLDAQAVAHAAKIAHAYADKSVEHAARMRAEQEWCEAAETDRLRKQLSAVIEAYDTLQTTVGGLHAEVEALRAEVVDLLVRPHRLREENDRLSADRDRAVAEALEHAAQVIEGADASYFGYRPEAPWDLFTRPHAAEIVRGLIPKEDEG